MLLLDRFLFNPPPVAEEEEEEEEEAEEAEEEEEVEEEDAWLLLPPPVGEAMAFSLSVLGKTNLNAFRQCVMAGASREIVLETSSKDFKSP